MSEWGLTWGHEWAVENKEGKLGIKARMESVVELDVEVVDERPAAEIGNVVVEVLLPLDWGECWCEKVVPWAVSEMPEVEW